MMALFCFWIGARSEDQRTEVGQLFISGEPGFELNEGFGHIAATVAEADVVALVVDGAREEKDSGFAYEAFAEGLHVLSGLEAVSYTHLTLPTN